MEREVGAFGKYWRSSPLVFSFEPRCMVTPGEPFSDRATTACRLCAQRLDGDPAHHHGCRAENGSREGSGESWGAGGSGKLGGDEVRGVAIKRASGAVVVPVWRRSA